MGILYTVSLPWCSITWHHIEWVNMILNYSFLCHSHFLFSEDLCLTSSLRSVQLWHWDKKSHCVCLELDLYIKLCISVYLLQGLREGMLDSGIGGSSIISCLSGPSSEIKQVNGFKRNLLKMIWAFANNVSWLFQNINFAAWDHEGQEFLSWVKTSRWFQLNSNFNQLWPSIHKDGHAFTLAPKNYCNCSRLIVTALVWFFLILLKSWYLLKYSKLEWWFSDWVCIEVTHRISVERGSIWLKQDYWVPPQPFQFCVHGVGPRLCISKQFQVDAEAVGLRNTLQEALEWTTARRKRERHGQQHHPPVHVPLPIFMKFKIRFTPGARFKSKSELKDADF